MSNLTDPSGPVKSGDNITVPHDSTTNPDAFPPRPADVTAILRRMQAKNMLHAQDGCADVECPCYRRGREEALEMGR